MKKKKEKEKKERKSGKASKCEIVCVCSDELLVQADGIPGHA